MNPTEHDILYWLLIGSGLMFIVGDLFYLFAKMIDSTK